MKGVYCNKLSIRYALVLLNLFYQIDYLWQIEGLLL